MYTIAREDIEQGDRQFWGEVSDGAETVYYVKTKAMPVPPSVVEALMPEKQIRPTSNHQPLRRMKKKVGSHTDKYGVERPDFETWDEENRFDSGYYERPIIGKLHRKVAITSPENVDKVAAFDKILYNK